MRSNASSKASFLLLQTVTILIIFAVLFIESTTSLFAKENDSAIEQSLRNSLPQQSDLASGIVWKSKGVTVRVSGKQGTGSVFWEGEKVTGGRGGYDFRAIAFSNYLGLDYDSNKSPVAHRASRIKFWSSGKSVSVQPYEGLPGGVIIHSQTGFWTFYNIYFWKNPYYHGDVKVEGSRLLEKKGVNVDALCRSECERLAKLVWSRLPDVKADKYIPPKAGTSTKGNQSGLSSKKEISNTTRDKKGKKLSGIPMEKDSAGLQADDIKDSSEEGSLPPWAPAAAGGVAAGVAAIGSWLMMLSNGIKPKEVWDGVKDLFTQLPIQKELMSEAVDTIDTEPLPPEPSSTPPELPTTPEKPPAEVEKDFFDQAEKEIREKEIAKPPAEDETGAILSSHKDGGGEKPLEKSLDDDEIEHLKGFLALKIEEDGDKLAKNGYWIINPGLSKTVHKASLPFNVINGKGVTCGDLREMKMDIVQKWATTQFGDGVVVQSVGVTEKSSAIGSGILDTLDSITEYNHVAIRVIQPNGKAFIVDYYNRLQGGTTIVEEDEWNNTWKYRVNETGGEPYLLTELKSGDEFEKPLEAMMQKYGPDRGIEEFYNEKVRQYKDDSKWTVLDEKTGKRDAFLKQTETYIRYIIRNGKKIKH